LGLLYKLYDGEIYAGCYSANKADFIKTLNFIKELDFNLVLPGHNKIMNRDEAIIIINKWKIVLRKK